MAARFVLSKGRGGKYFFSLKAGNGEVILASQMYESHGNALNGIASVKDNAGKDERFERLASFFVANERHVHQFRPVAGFL